MSARTLRVGAACGLVAVGLLASPCGASDYDPLLAIPDVLETGVALPGDKAPPSCPVEWDASQPLTLGTAVDVALCNNAQIRSAWASIKGQAATLGEARAAYLPTASVSMSRTADELRYPDSALAPSSVQASTVNAGLNWRLLDSGTRGANLNQAESLLAAALASHDAAIQKALGTLIQSYFDALTARALVTAKVQGEQLAAQTLASAQRREAKGAISRSDSLQAATAHARAVLERGRADSGYQRAAAILSYAMGQTGGGPISLPEDHGEVIEAELAPLGHWLDQARQTHPALVAARAQLEAARHKAEATSAEGLPTLDLSSNYYQNGRPGQALTPTKVHESTVGIVLTVPIFEGFARSYKVYGAQAQVEQKAAELADLEGQILVEVIKTHADASSAVNNLNASLDLLTAAQDALAVAQRKYDKGAADVLEVLNAQSALADARQERIRTLSEWRSARLRLQTSTGRLGRSGLDK